MKNKVDDIKKALMDAASKAITSQNNVYLIDQKVSLLKNSQLVMTEIVNLTATALRNVVHTVGQISSDGEVDVIVPPPVIPPPCSALQTISLIH